MSQYRGMFRTMENIYNGTLLRKQLTTKKANYFQNNFHYRCLTGPQIRLPYASEYLVSKLRKKL